jgi:hypothetical protein
VAVLTRSIPVRVAWVLLMCAATAGCRFGAEQWGPFRGRMVDAETGAPIPGAHFMVSWERDLPNPVHWTQSFYDAQEAVTDADGRFEIPRQRRFFTLLVSEPRFGAFAPGYFAEAEEVISPEGQLYVDDTVLRMRRLQTRAEQCEREPLGIGGRFPKDEVPRFSAAIDEYVSRLACAR